MMPRSQPAILAVACALAWLAVGAWMRAMWRGR